MDSRTVEVHGVRVDRLAMLAEFLREEAIAVTSRAKFEDAINGEELKTALSLITRIDSNATRLIDTLTTRRKP